MPRNRFVFLLLVLLPAAIHAEVRLPALISDGMVIQRDAEIRIQGWADPAEEVTVRFLNQSRSVSANEEGCWEVTFPPAMAGGPHTLTVAGQNELVLHNILIGDVWLASGQSNMELPMSRVEERYPDEVARADYPTIRYFEVGKEYDFRGPRKDVGSGEWQVTSPRTASRFSALAYFFAKDVFLHTGVPVGIINASVGGTPVEAWMSEEALQDFPESREKMKRFRDDALVDRILRENAATQRAWYEALESGDAGMNGDLPWFDSALDVTDWDTMEVPGDWTDGGPGPLSGVVWFRKTVTIPASHAGREGKLYLGAIVDADTAFVNGVQVGQTGYRYPPRIYTIPPGILRTGENVVAVRVLSHAGEGAFIPDKQYELLIGDRPFDLKGPWRYRTGATFPPLPPPVFLQREPGGLFNAMIAPLLRFPIAGAIWYQGESNVERAGNYHALLSRMLADWRSRWGVGDFPFLFVQLANFGEPPAAPGVSQWAELREQQRRMLDAPKTAMVVTIDLGEWNDIHPLNKEDVGKRLALAARKLAYRDPDVIASGPHLTSARLDASRAVLTFSDVAGGLVAKDADEPRGFTIAGEDGRYVRAHARIEGNQVMVWSPAIQSPRSVRYAWADNPTSANLYNQAGLPASPFEAIIER